jgi:hypothetical protein
MPTFKITYAEDETETETVEADAQDFTFRLHGGAQVGDHAPSARGTESDRGLRFAAAEPRSQSPFGSRGEASAARDRSQVVACPDSASSMCSPCSGG